MSNLFSCIEVQSLTEENLSRVIAYCKRFGMTSIAYMAADWGKFQLLDHTEWGVPPPDDEAVAFTKNLQATIQRASETVSDAGLGFYLWRREARLPVGFVEKYGQDWIRSENPEIWRFVAWNLESIFKLFPKVSGLILTCTGEQTPNEWISANGMAGSDPLEIRFEKMFRVASDICKSYGRDLVLRTHGIGNAAGKLRKDPEGYLETFLKAVGNVDKAQKIMGKSVEPDYQPGYPFNVVLGPMADHQPTLIEFSLPMEYNGVSRIPFPMVEDIQFRMQYAASVGCAGFVARIDWHMSGHQAERTWSCLDTPNEINAYAFGRLFNEPALTVEEIRKDYVIERYGKAAARVMGDVYRGLYTAGIKQYYELGHRASYTPSGAFLPPWTAATLLRRAEPHRWSHSAYDFINNQHALAPDAQYIALLEKEKDEAVAIYRNALNLVRENQRLLSPADFQQWEKGLSRALCECVIRKHQALAFYHWLAFENSGAEDHAQQVEERLAQAEPLIKAHSAEYDAAELDPEIGNSFAYGANARATLDKQREALAGSRAYWRSCCVSAGEKRRVYSRYELKAYDLPASDWRVRLNVDLLRLQILENGNTPVVSLRPFLHLLLGGLLIGEHLTHSFNGHRLYRESSGSVRLEILTMFHNLSVSLVAHPECRAVLVRVKVEDLPPDSRILLPWMTEDAADAGSDACLPKDAKVLLSSSGVIRRQAVLRHNDRPLVVADTTLVHGAFSPISAEGTWGWTGQGTGAVEVILHGP